MKCFNISYAKSDQQMLEVTSIRSSNEFHIYRKKHFHKNRLIFRIIADFEADKENDKSGIGKKQLIFLNKSYV